MVLKFFLDKRAFAVEQHLFSLPALQAALVAPAANANAEGHARSPQGHALPPHTVAEVAQPLETWMAGGHSGDFITCVQVRCKHACCARMHHLEHAHTILQHALKYI